MKSIYSVGCDVGNNTIKVKTKNDLYQIDTLVKKPFEARKIFGKGDHGNPINYLDVDIESKDIDGNYYLGSLASKGGDGSQESLGGFKSENKLLKVAALTSIAYAMAIEHQDKNEFNIALGTGLPVREFFFKNSSGVYDFSKVKKYINQFIGKHKVKLNSKLFDRREITLVFDGEYIECLPECYAGLLTIVNDQNGNIKPEYKKVGLNIVAGDLGGGSFDVAGYSNGDYIEQCMFGFDIGINEAQDQLCELIKANANLSSFTRYELNRYIYDEELAGKLETNRGTFDLNAEKRTFYKALTDKVVYNFKKNLQANRFDVSRIHYLYLLGGGNVEIGSMIKDELLKDIKKIEVVANLINRNVEAYFNAVKDYGETE